MSVKLLLFNLLLVSCYTLPIPYHPPTSYLITPIPYINVCTYNHINISGITHRVMYRSVHLTYWSTTMTIIVTYLLIDSVSEQEKEFGALSAVADWVKGIGEDMFTSIEISNGYDEDITDFQTMHDIVNANRESEYNAFIANL